MPLLATTNGRTTGTPDARRVAGIDLRTVGPALLVLALAVVHGSVEVQAAPFDGTRSALLTRVNEITSDLERLQGSAAARSRRYAVRMRQGAVGVGEDFVGVHRQGTIVAFVFRSHGPSTGSQGEPSGVGVEVVASGPDGAISRRRDDIVAMIRSIRTAS